MNTSNETPEVKNHFLKSIQDIYDVIDEENIEFFLEDFRMFAVDCVKAKMINKLACSMAEEKEVGLEIEHFHWIEDGKHDNHGCFITESDGKNSVTIDVNDTSDKISKLVSEYQPKKDISDKELRDMAEAHYGNDIHIYAKQRDGFVTGAKAILASSIPIIDKGEEGIKDFIIDGIIEGSEQWRAEYDNCRAILKELVYLKRLKESSFKEDIDTYQKRKPLAWDTARKFLEKYQH